MQIFKGIKNRLNYIRLSNKFYRTFLAPFDKILYQTVSHNSIEKERKNGIISLNKIPHIADVSHTEWTNSSRDLGEHYWCIDKPNFHRKLWEYNQILYSLRKLKFTTPGAKALSVGAGHEPLLYLLTHLINKVIGIDLYESSFFGGEDDTDTIDSIEKYAPFPYKADKIELKQMDALDLKFPDNSFDFIFCISSLEHFGSLKSMQKSIDEMFRVLKPGGCAIITTELRLNRVGGVIPGARIFSLNQLLSMFSNSGFKLHSDEIDTRIEEEYLQQMRKLPEEVNQRPHIFLRFFRTIFTSINLVFFKPGNLAVRGEEKKVKIPEFKYGADIQIKTKVTKVKAGADIPITIFLKNLSTFNWFVSGMSHRIAVGLKLQDADGNMLDEGYGEFSIPRNLPIGSEIEFATTIKAPQHPGRYKILFDLKRELITWFSERGTTPFTLDIEVD